MWLWYLRWPLGDDLRQMWRQFVLSSNFECTPKSDCVANKNLVPTNPNKCEKLIKAYYGIQITRFQQSLWTVTRVLLNGFKWYQAANAALKHRVEAKSIKDNIKITNTVFACIIQTLTTHDFVAIKQGFDLMVTSCISLRHVCQCHPLSYFFPWGLKKIQDWDLQNVNGKLKMLHSTVMVTIISYMRKNCWQHGILTVAFPSICNWQLRNTLQNWHLGGGAGRWRRWSPSQLS